MTRGDRAQGWGIGIIIFVLTQLSLTLEAGEVMTKGAEKGRWTMDLDAAQKLAAEENLVVFLDFTGSDWCGWCIRMNKQVFSKDGWEKFAEEKLALVKIDFPRNQNLVPEAYRQRNRTLQSKYSVGGYPTYILLDSDGKSELGRLGAGHNKTLESFKKEVIQLFRRSSAGAAQFAAKLPGAVGEKYGKSSQQLRAKRGQYKAWLASRPQTTPANLDLFLTYRREITKLSNQVEKIEFEADASKMAPDEASRYRALYADLHQARHALDDWHESRPDSAAASNDEQARLQTRIDDISRQLQEF